MTAPGGVRGEATLAVAFLTILPVRPPADAPVDLGRSAAWFGLVGAAVGLAAGGTYAGLDSLVGSGPATVLALAVLVVLTGALHQDGLADTADGLGARGAGPQRRLEAMRDPAIGAFGVLALVGWALALYAAVEPLDARDTVSALTAGAATGRWAAVAHAAAAPPARPDGLGAGFHVSRASLVLGGAATLGLAMALCDPLPGLAAFAAAGATGVLVARAVRSLLGGRTGDTLGAAVALAEIAAVLVLVATW